MKKGDLVEVEFYDHAKNHEPYLFTVWGRVYSYTEEFLKLMTWDYADSDEEMYDGGDDDNIEYVSILRSCIKKMRKLR